MSDAVINFSEFVSNYWTSIVFVVLLSALVVMLFKLGYSKYAKQICFYLVCEAEKQFGDGTGVLKYAAVTSWLYDKLPLICKVIFTEKQIDKMIETSVSEMKEWLSKNDKANSLISTSK